MPSQKVQALLLEMLDATASLEECQDFDTDTIHYV